MSYRKTSHSVHDLKYHVVRITKYRKPALRGEIAARLRELGRQTCATVDLYILSGHIAVDHVHLSVSVPPQVSVSKLMQRIKGRSGRKMLEEYGELSRQFWGRHLWARGYFAASSGNAADGIIKQYIKSQGQKPPSAEDDGFAIGELWANFPRSPSYRLEPEVVKSCHHLLSHGALHNKHLLTDNIAFPFSFLVDQMRTRYLM